MKRYLVDLSEVQYLFKKDLPRPIVLKLFNWAMRVQLIGLLETRKISGFHDEPLMGERINQRSIRLNRSYRAIYIVDESEMIVTVKVIGVNKHEY